MLICPPPMNSRVSPANARFSSAMLFGFEPLTCELERPAVLSDRSYDVLGCAAWDVRFNIERHLDVCSYQPCQMSNNLVGNSASVSAYSRGIETHGAVETLRPCRLCFGCR